MLTSHCILRKKYVTAPHVLKKTPLHPSLFSQFLFVIEKEKEKKKEKQTSINLQQGV